MASERGGPLVRLRKRKSALYGPETAGGGGLGGRVAAVFGGGKKSLVLTAAVATRLLNCFLVQSSFVPDEYWQSLEVAHRMVFGYGHLTWEWAEGLRSYLYPLLFASIYKALQLLQEDRVQLLIWLPRVVQALLAALADVKLYSLVKRMENAETAKWVPWLFDPGGPGLHHPPNSCHPLGPPAALALLERAPETAPRPAQVPPHRWTVVQLNFAKFNVLQNVATFYGSHPWHWYWTQGWPVVLGPHLPFFVHGCFQASRRHGLLLAVVFWTVTAYSMLSHKEFRFIYPVLPICMVVCGHSLSQLKRWRRAAVSFLLVSNTVLALYTGLVHQRGALDVMGHLRGLCSPPAPREGPSVLMLMPCHSTPYYSHIHCQLRLRFLQCPPDLMGEAEYQDEADRFYAGPLRWLAQEFPNATLLPSHLVFFSVLEQDIAPFLVSKGYERAATFFHTHLPQGRIGSHIYVYRRDQKPT
ncbi:GPI alpha-1,2-mannosyltransferase 3 isoform X2 [Pogona vitticeps]